MFFGFLKYLKPNPQARPAVKRVSEFVDFKTRRQKKYISLMVVPSYSGSKTRSLHIPYTVFYGTLLFFFTISAMVAGFYLKTLYFENMTHTLTYTLEETLENFDEFRQEARLTNLFLHENSVYMFEQLSNEKNRAQNAFYHQERTHQVNYDSVQEAINHMERQVREFEAERMGILELLEERAAIIPPIADTVRRVQASQKSLASELFSVKEENEYTLSALPDTPMVLGAKSPDAEVEFHARLIALANELENQWLLIENLEAYMVQIDEYLSNFPTLMPIIGGVVTSGFGTRRDPFTGRPAFHEGVDIPAPLGTPIHAAGGGIVTYSGVRGGYGNVVFIDHGGGLQTRYAHNTHNIVSVGERVERGQVIAYVGSTGRSLSPHLHYEVLLNGQRIDPVGFLREEI